MLTGQTVKTEPTCSSDSYNSLNSLSFILLSDGGEEIGPLPVTVKSLTSAGIILEILPQVNGLRLEDLKGREGLLTGAGPEDCPSLKVPGKILWIRQHQDEAGVTLGLELLEPIPLVVRQTLETNMAIGAKDMKVLWDYWDEIQASADPIETALPAPPVSIAAETTEPIDNEEDSGEHNIWPYILGFAAIIAGLVMLLPQSEYLGFSGLGMMLLGSLIIAWHSIWSMRAASGPERTE